MIKTKENEYLFLFFFYSVTLNSLSLGQYRKGYSGCIEHFEDLQHDLAVVGQIAGLVATLRRSYQVCLLIFEDCSTTSEVEGAVFVVVIAAVVLVVVVAVAVAAAVAVAVV